MPITPKNVPAPGHLPFNPMILDPNRRLSWDEILRLPGNNALKNLYYANQRWEALKAHAAVVMQQQANLAEQAAMEEPQRHRAGHVDKPDINAQGRDPEEMLLEAGIDPSSGPLEELAEELRAKRAVELIYTPDEATYSLTEALLSAFSRGLDFATFHAALMAAAISAEKQEAHRSLKDKLLDDLYQHHPDMTFQHWVMAEYFAHRLASALISLGYTADSYAAALHPSNRAKPAFVEDFENHVNRISTLAANCRDKVEMSGAPDINPSFFQKPTPFQVPQQKEDELNVDWRYEVALRYVQSQCPDVATLRTEPVEQMDQLQTQQHRASPFPIKPQAPAPVSRAKDKLENMATNVFMVPLETLVTRAIYGAMRVLGVEPQMQTQIEMQTLNNEKHRAPSPFMPPRPEDRDKK